MESLNELASWPVISYCQRVQRLGFTTLLILRGILKCLEGRKNINCWKMVETVQSIDVVWVTILLWLWLKYRVESCVSRSESCFSRSESCVSRSESCVSRSESCFSRSESCLSRSESCFSRSESCFSRSESCLSRSESCFSRSESCFSRSESCLSRSESSAFLGQSPAFLVQSPAFLGQSPAFLGHCPAFLGQSPAFLGQSPAYWSEYWTTLGPDSNSIECREESWNSTLLLALGTSSVPCEWAPAKFTQVLHKTRRTNFLSGVEVVEMWWYWGQSRVCVW
jgi:hypothetical protein